MLNGLSLFSGIGGLELALRPWVRPIAYCEQDPHPSGQTYVHCRCRICLPLTSFSEASPARTSVLRVLEQVWRATDQGLYSNSSASLANADLDSSSWKTSQLSLFGGLTEFSWSSMRWGLMRDGQLFQPQRWEPRTCENESGFLPTPAANEYGTNQTDSPGAKVRPSLSTMARKNLWPTPRASDGEKGGPNQRGSRGDLALPAAVHRFPSPWARDWKGQGKDCLDTAVGGQLNPTWVEWLMGFPIGWTESSAWATQWFRSQREKRSED